MTANLKPYPEYKDSGLPWLGEIPKHWEIMKMKYLFRERIEKGYPDEPLLAATQTMGVVRKEHYENRTVLALKDLHLLKLVRISDFVISLRSFQGGIEYAHYQGIISPAYTVLRPFQQVNPKYFTALLKSKLYINNLSIFVTGIRQGQNIDYERLSRSFLPVPMFEEQEKIGAFVTHANHRINQLISYKRWLIELLNEQKQVIIQRAVTCGLDSKVPMKYSGVEWLGEIPSHWEVKKLKYLVSSDPNSFVDGPFGSDLKNEEYKDEGVPLIQLNNIFDRKHVLQNMKFISNEKANDLARHIIFPGHIVIAKMADPVARAACVNDAYPKYVIVADCVKFIPNNKSAYVPFLVYAMNSPYFRYSAELLSTGTTRRRINLGTIKNLTIFLPPLSEQSAIASYLDLETARIDSLISQISETVEKLREYRTRLIADVVTGKLDVRGVELPIMDEAVTLEDIDTVENAEVEELIEIEEVVDAYE